MISAPFDFSGTGLDFAGLFGLTTAPASSTEPQLYPLAAAAPVRLRLLPHGPGGHAATRRRLLALRPGGRRRPCPDGHAPWPRRFTLTLQAGWNQIGDPFARRRRCPTSRSPPPPARPVPCPRPAPGQPDLYTYPPRQQWLQHGDEHAPALRRLLDLCPAGALPDIHLASTLPAARRREQFRRRGFRRGGEASPPRFFWLPGAKSRYNLTARWHARSQAGCTQWAAVNWGGPAHRRGHPDRRVPDLPPDDAGQGHPRLADHLGPAGLRADPRPLLVGAAPRAELDPAADVPARPGRHRDPVLPELRHALEEVGRLGFWGKGFTGLDKEDLSRMVGEWSAPPACCPTARSAR